ncbi:hypothetical protein BJ912DRAFT_937969 [Pholiota molesta]|nr:hypothetical protein BJ912DRAFT_937969 [Pholiota molesta]
MSRAAVIAILATLRSMLDWEATLHLQSKSHIKMASQPKVGPIKKITMFFGKATTVRGQAPTPVKAPSVLLSHKPLLTTTSNSHPIDPPLPPSPPAQHESAVQALHPLLKSLHQAISTLPHEVPEAIPSDSLAVFSVPPAVDPDDDEGPFRAIDGALNCVIGFGCEAEAHCSLLMRELSVARWRGAIWYTTLSVKD